MGDHISGHNAIRERFAETARSEFLITKYYRFITYEIYYCTHTHTSYTQVLFKKKTIIIIIIIKSLRKTTTKLFCDVALRVS